jgi:cold shock CspA family protein
MFNSFKNSQVSKQQQFQQLQQQIQQENSNKEVLGDQMFGLIAIVSKLACNYDIFPNIPDGRITYTKNGETFYIPYALNDVVNYKKQLPLKQSDRVKFYIAQNLQMGTIYARKVELISDNSLIVNMSNDAKQQLTIYRGIVSTLKDTFGRIEREDKAREILFHFTEFKGSLNEIHIGANVQFEIDNRHVILLSFFFNCLDHQN